MFDSQAPLISVLLFYMSIEGLRYLVILYVLRGKLLRADLIL